MSVCVCVCVRPVLVEAVCCESCVLAVSCECRVSDVCECVCE